MPLLEVAGLVKRFGRRAVVNGVSFAVDPGEVVGLLGPNGAGKTTSFRMATGQIAPNDGRVTFNGEDVTGLPMYQRARRGMGYLSQEPSVFRKLSVEQNLLAILEALPKSRSLGRKLTRSERRERTDEALARFKLDHVRHNPAARCSGGEKRRLEIARCLVCEPLLILLDEPFAAVDPKTTEDIRRNIRALAGAGIGVLITDHNVREVFRSADRVYLISDGKVVTHGTPHELVNDQKAVDAYLGRSFEEDGFTRHFAARSQTVPGGGPTTTTAAAPPAPRIDRAGPGPAPEPATPVVAKTPPPNPLPHRERGNQSKTLPTSPVPPTEKVDRTDAPVLSPLPAPGRGLGGGVPLPDAPPLAFPQPGAFPAPPPAPAVGGFSGAVGGMLGLELLRRAVENLADDSTVKAATVEVASKGPAAIDPLLDALERRDPVLRRRAFEVLKFVAKDRGPLVYDPDAPDDVRLRQAAHLRVKLQRAA